LQWLAARKIMDYSFLVGVCYKTKENKKETARNHTKDNKKESSTLEV